MLTNVHWARFDRGAQSASMEDARYYFAVMRAYPLARQKRDEYLSLQRRLDVLAEQLNDVRVEV